MPRLLLYNTAIRGESVKSHPGNTKRITFSNWQNQNIDLAKLLWGDADVTRYICASGVFSEEEIISRLNKEL